LNMNQLNLVPENVVQVIFPVKLIKFQNDF
jgi:hypothetical protein